MRIGLTYDLKQEYLALGYDAEAVAEFDRIETIEAIEAVLYGAGHEVSRIGGAQSLVRRLAVGERWDLVFNIAEGLHGRARESQVPAILDAFEVPYTFAEAHTLAICLDKRLAKHVVREHGLPTPDFVVIENLEALAALTLPWPLFAKPIAEGSSRGVTAQSFVRNAAELVSCCCDLLGVYRQPVLVERYLPGREFTVGILGTGAEARVLGVLEVQLAATGPGASYSYEAKEHYLERVTYTLPSDSEALGARELALAAYRALGCRDAGRIDLRSDENGIPNFIEANPLAGLNPADSDLSILARHVQKPYPELILEIVASACRRRALPVKAP